jgi:hypothetical protein
MLGISAICGGFIYIIWPIESNKALMCIPAFILAAIYVCLLIIVFFPTLTLLAAELFFPLLGYYLLTWIYANLGGIAVVITLISYITAWIALRRYQWRLLRKTWQSAKEIYNKFVEPIYTRAEALFKRAEKIGEWIRG